MAAVGKGERRCLRRNPFTRSSAGCAGATLTVADDNAPPRTDFAQSTIEVVRPLGQIDLLELTGLNASSWYSLETTRAGYVTLEALDPAAELTLYDEGFNPLADCRSTDSGRRLDYASAQAGQLFYLELSGSGTNVLLRLANLVSHDGLQVGVFGTAEDDLFQFDAAGQTLAIDGVAYELGLFPGASDIRFYGLAGRDTAVLSGTPGNDEVRLYPGEGRFSTGGIDQIVWVYAETINVDGGGGWELGLFVQRGPHFQLPGDGA